MINNREKGKLSLSLKKGENLGWTDTTITGREGIIQSSRRQITISWSELYSENPCIKSWKMLRMNPSSSGPIRWWETLKRETEIYIVNTIETMVTLPRIAEVYGISWTNLSDKANWNSCCITLVVWWSDRYSTGKGESFTTPSRNYQRYFCDARQNRVVPF